ncbi:unnamed protein product [Chironomus riparius]|uniref:Uncharacterized protein n=1 Tax=Chironomus riparius TaxID=315576 RepID=A0A9N9WTP5_9DIPT|nr:unnamed protein product [Chironomus riparius]
MNRCNCCALKASTFTKCARGIVFCVSIVGLLYYVNECYKKLKVTPEVLVNEKIVNSWSVPFPAVTVCAPLIAKSEILNFTKCQEELTHGRDLNDDVMEKLVAYQHVCPEPFYLASLRNKYVESGKDHGVILKRISSKINDVLNICAVDDFVGCKHIYIRSLTDAGFCYSFNMLGYQSIFNNGIVKDFDVYKRTKIVKTFDPNVVPEFYDDVNNPEPSSWSLQKGYPVNDNSSHPVPAVTGRALIAQLKIRRDENPNFCRDRSSLYFVFLHLPNEVATRMHQNHFFKLNTVNVLQISAEIKENDKSLRSFSKQERACFFEGERRLKFFKSYTKINCENECLINFTRRQCGCVRPTMPRTKDMNVCKLKDIPCYQAIAKSWPMSYFKSTERHPKYTNFFCGCMPLCTQIKYTIIDKVTISTAQQNDGHDYSTLTIKFDEAQIVKRTNYVTYKLQNFMSDVGGLVGFFLGFSMLSLFESALKLFSLLKVVLDRLVSKQTEQEVTTENKNEVQSLNNVVWTEDETNVSERKEQIFIIPKRPSTPLVVEDLEM